MSDGNGPLPPAPPVPPTALDYLKRIAEAHEKSAQAVLSTTAKVDAIIEAAGGVEGIKAKFALLKMFTGK